MLGDTAVLDLLLTARYVGGPAFGAMARDIAAISEAPSGLSKVGAAFSTLGTISMGAGLAVAGAAAIAIESSQKWQQALLDIQAATGATNLQMAQLAMQFQNASARVGENSVEIANGAYFILSGMQSLGVTVPQVIQSKVIPAFADYIKVSQAGGIATGDISQTAQDLVHILGGLNVPVENWADSMGILSILEKDASLTQQQLTAAMLRVAPVARILGMSFTDVAVTAATMASSGLAGARAGTELASALRIVTTNAKAMKELGKVGIDPKQFFDANNNLKDMGSILDMITPKLAGLSKPDQLRIITTLFGAVGEKSLGLLLNPDSRKTMDRLNADIPKGPGQATSALDQRALKMTKPIDALRESLRNLFNTMGTVMTVILIPFINHLTDLMQKVNAFITLHPKLAATIGQGMLAAAPLLIGSGIGFKGVGGIFSWLGEAKKLEGGGKGPTRAARMLGGMGGLADDLFLRGFVGGDDIWKGLAKSPAKIGRAIEFANTNSLDTVVPVMGEALAKRHDKFLISMTNRFPHAFAGRMEEFGIRERGEGRGMPNLGFMLGLGKDVGGGIGGMFTKMGTGIAGLLPMLPGLAAGILSVLGPVLLVAGAVALIVLVITHFRKEAAAAGQQIGNGLAPIFKFVGAVIQAVMTQIRSAWDSAWPRIHGAVEAFLRVLPKITPLLFMMIAPLVAIGTIAAAVLTGLVTGFINALSDIITMFTGAFQIIGGIFEFFEGLWVLITTGNGDKLKQAVKDIWEGIKNLIGGALKGIWDLISGVFGGIADFFGNVWDAINGKTQKGTQKHTEHIKKMADTSKKTMDTMATNQQTTMSTMTDQSNQDWQKMLANQDTNLSTMDSNSLDSFTQMQQNGCGAVDGLQNCVDKHTQNASNLADQHVGTMSAKVLKKMMDMTAGVDANTSPLPVIVDSHMKAALDTVNRIDMKGAGTSSGQSLMDGFQYGIDSRLKAVLDSIDATASGIDAHFRNRMKISSPSRVFMEHGRNIMAGLQAGLRMESSVFGDLALPGLSGSDDGPSHVIVDNPWNMGEGHSHPEINTHAFARSVHSIRESRYGPAQAVTAGQINSYLDRQYRHSYQQTA